MYKCPADVYLSPAQRRAGWSGRLRSTSMNALFGLSDTSPASASGRSWAEGGVYRQFLKIFDIPNPSDTWVTLTEQADSLNDGFFVVPLNTATWGDYPSSYHNGGCTFGFADGHVETHIWHSSTSKIPVKYSFSSARPFDAAGRNDYAWYKAHTGYVPFK